MAGRLQGLQSGWLAEALAFADVQRGLLPPESADSPSRKRGGAPHRSM